MASNKQPPLELDDLTNNLKQSSGKGVDAFFSAPPPPQAEKKPVMHEEQDKKESQKETLHPVPSGTSSTTGTPRTTSTGSTPEAGDEGTLAGEHLPRPI